MSADALARRLAAELPSLPSRRLLLIPPCGRTALAKAWAPDAVMIQLLLSGTIPQDVPHGSGLRRVTAGPGDLLLICPGGWARRHLDTPRHHLTAFVWPQPVLREISSPGDGRLHAPTAEAVVDPPPALADTVAALTTCATAAPQAEVLGPLACAFLALLVPALRSGDGTAARRRAAIRAWIVERCHEDLSRNDVATHFGIGGDHLSRLLRQGGDGSFIGLVHRCRMERATELLRQGDGSLGQIARRCGLRSASYFIRLFRRRHGITPERWRRLHQMAHGDAVAT